MLINSTPVIIEIGMESQSFVVGLLILAALFFIAWFIAGRKGGYGRPNVLNMKKGEGVSRAILQSDMAPTPEYRDVTPQAEKLTQYSGASHLSPPPPPPAQATFVYNGHDWDAFEVLGVSPYSSFSEITKQYQIAIKKADGGKHEFLQAAYMAILKIK